MRTMHGETSIFVERGQTVSMVTGINVVSITQGCFHREPDENIVSHPQTAKVCKSVETDLVDFTYRSLT